MKLNLIQLFDYEQELNSLFKYYPVELIEASLSAFAFNKTTFIPEELTITQLFQQELKVSMQRCLFNYLQNYNYPEPVLEEEVNLKNIQSVIKILTAFIPIGYIFCSNPKQNNCSLTIVLDQYHYKPIEEVESLVNFALKSNHNFRCNVFTYGTMVDRIRSGHLYYSNLCISTNCIYQSNPSFNLPIADPALLATTKLKALVNYGLYHSKADHFFTGAEQFFKNKQYAMAAFMLQQACEFTFNGILTVLIGKSIKSHDLLMLHKQASHYLPQLVGLIHHKPKKEMQILTQIQEAYVKARYDENYQISEEELVKLFTATKQLLHCVKIILNEQLT